MAAVAAVPGARAAFQSQPPLDGAPAQLTLTLILTLTLTLTVTLTLILALTLAPTRCPRRAGRRARGRARGGRLLPDDLEDRRR